MASTSINETMSSDAYASPAEFEQIFREDMGGLYLLSLLLAGDHRKAEECLVAGFGESRKRNRVFKEWARSWARRTIVQSAIRLVVPRQRSMTPNPVSPGNLHDLPSGLKAELSAIIELAPFERFVFVMSVLERYSEHECSVLLGCSRRDIAATLALAVQHLARLLSLHKGGTDGSSEGLADLETSRLVIDLTISRYFTTPGWNPSLSL